MHYKSPVILITLLHIIFGADYFQQDVAYEIHVTLDDSAHTLSAFESLQYTNNSPDVLEYIWFHLWPNAYKNNQTALEDQFRARRNSRMTFATEEERGYIDSLDFRSNGQSMEWEYHPDWIDVAKIYLPTPLQPGETVTIETPFYVKLPKVFSRLGHTGQHYEITQWYPKPAVYDKNGWHPMPYLDMGEFYSEFGTFDVHITLPNDYRIMATGDLVNGESELVWLDSLSKEGDALYELDKKSRKKALKELSKAKRSKTGMKTLHFHQENVHDFAWFADWKWIVRKGELFLGDSTKPITLWSMYLPKNSDLWEHSIEYLHDSGYWYSEFFGDYPYNHITAVDGDMSAGGGMEYPNITVISSGGTRDLLEFVIMHEVGHNWFYGILGNNEREAPWLDEGLNEFANVKYWEKKYGDRNESIMLQEDVQEKIGIGRNIQMKWLMGYMGYIIQANPGNDQAINLRAEEYTRSNYGSIVYGKTAVTFRFLQHYLGEEKMDNIMQHYYEAWKFKHPSQKDLEDAFSMFVEEDLSWFWENAIGSTKQIDYGVRQDGDSYYLANHGSMSVPVEVAYYNNTREEIGRQWIAIKNQAMPLPVPDGVEKIVIDPDDQMPDVNRSNNTTNKSFDFVFVFDQPDYKDRTFYWLPWVTEWNQYNGWTPGLKIYSGFIPGYRYGLGITPMWDIEHSRLMGSVTAQKTMFQTFGFQSITVKGEYFDHSSASGWGLESNLVKEPSIHSRARWEIDLKIRERTLYGDGLVNTRYESGSYTTFSTRTQFTNRPSTRLSYGSSASLQIALSGGSFAKWNFINTMRYRWTKNEYSSLRLWTGGFISSDEVPTHYQTFLSGGVDPEFEQSLILNRTATENVINIYDEQFVKDGPSLKGFNDMAVVESFIWGLNVVLDIPYIPVNLFADVSGFTSNTYTDLGLLLGSEDMGLFIPLYMSWEDENTPDSFDWILKNARFSISIPTFISF